MITPFDSPLPRWLGAAVLALALVLVQGCGGGTDGGAESTEEGSAERTGGIFGGTVQPRSGGDAGSRPQSRSPARPGARAGPGEGIDLSGMGYTAGSMSAPVRVVEFSDFGCGYCRRFHVEVYPTLREEYVETGRVRWKYIPFVLGIFPNGEEGAIAGECVIRHGRDAFPAFRDRLFEDQSAWRDAENPTEIFVEVAAAEGVDPAPLRRCIQDRGTMDRVRANNASGREFGIRGTPSFLINGFPLHGAQPLNIFRNVFDDMLNRAEQGRE